MVTMMLGEASSPSLRKRTRRRTPSCGAVAPNMLLMGFACLLLPARVAATIFLPEFNRSFTSLPALFGKQLTLNPVSAYLTFIPDQPFMCPDELLHMQQKPPLDSMNHHNSHYHSGDSNSMWYKRKEENQMANDNNTATNETTSNIMDSKMMIATNSTGNNSNDNPSSDSVQPLPAPSDGLPVALLVERGMCTFYEKAAMASMYGPSVKYVIIYDDQIAPDLVPMTSTSGLDTNMTLLFVSASAGRELLEYIVHGDMEGFLKFNGHISETHNDPSKLYDLVVQMDADSPMFDPAYPALNMAAYFLAAMSGFLAFLIFFGCLLICAQCGCITAAPDEHGRIVLFAGGPGIRHTEGLARMMRVDKLTRDQVLLLDEESFEADSEESGSGGGDDEGDSSACCAICIDEFEHGEKVRVLPCGHKFHEDCLIPWLTERHASCPLCKMDVLKYVEEIEKKQQKKAGPSVDKEVTPIEDGSPDDSASTATQASSPRSFWYRLRGWSLVANHPEQGRGESINGTEQGSSELVGVSEIEMETRSGRSEAEEAVHP